MKVYASFNEDGDVVGFYPDFVFPDILDEDDTVTGRNPGVPVDAIEITEDRWKEIAGHPGAWRLVDGEIVPYTPPPVIPSQVSRAQGKIQLKRAGLWPKVLSLVDADSTGEIDVWLNDAAFWSRSSPYIAQMAAALNLTEDQVDQLFIEAVKIRPE